MLRAGRRGQALHQNTNQYSQGRLGRRGTGGFPEVSSAGWHDPDGATRLHESISDRAYFQQVGERHEVPSRGEAHSWPFRCSNSIFICQKRSRGSWWGGATAGAALQCTCRELRPAGWAPKGCDRRTIDNLCRTDRNRKSAGRGSSPSVKAVIRLQPVGPSPSRSAGAPAVSAAVPE